ncbi:MAG: pyruvate dehydrogenase E1 component, partial [Comamonadaceae bacterium]
MNVNDDLDTLETGEWMDALRAVQQHRGTGRTNYIVNRLVDEARRE